MLNMQSSQRFIRKSHGAYAAGCNFGLTHMQRGKVRGRGRGRERETGKERDVERPA